MIIPIINWYFILINVDWLESTSWSRHSTLCDHKGQQRKRRFLDSKQHIRLRMEWLSHRLYPQSEASTSSEVLGSQHYSVYLRDVLDRACHVDGGSLCRPRGTLHRRFDLCLVVDVHGISGWNLRTSFLEIKLTLLNKIRILIIKWLTIRNLKRNLETKFNL